MRGLLYAAIAAMALGMTPRESVRQLVARADAGEPEALYQLARLHDIGYDSIEVDTLRSTELYRRSALAGYAPALNYLGFRYFKGEGVKADKDSAIYWMRLAADAGDPGAANNLGYLYASGMLDTTDYTEARRWFGRAAEKGIHAAEAQLADLYREGMGGPADTLAAIGLYTRAIKGGLADAQLKLISMEGKGWESLPADTLLRLGDEFDGINGVAVSATLYRLAAEKGNAKAMTRLGKAYALGRGVPYSHPLSIEWYRKGAENGDEEAAEVIDELLQIFPDALDVKSKK